MFKIFQSVSEALSFVINSNIKLPCSYAELEDALLKRSIYSTPKKDIIIIVDKHNILA